MMEDLHRLLSSLLHGNAQFEASRIGAMASAGRLLWKPTNRRSHDDNDFFHTEKIIMCNGPVFIILGLFYHMSVLAFTIIVFAIAVDSPHLGSSNTLHSVKQF